MPSGLWRCPRCRRRFRRKAQRHACGIGDRGHILRNRPKALIELFGALEAAAKRLGDVEVVARERYALFRTTRIFADAVVMKDALRLAIHLDRQASHPLFFKVAQERRGRVSHVALLRTLDDVSAVWRHVEEAYRLAQREDARRIRDRPVSAGPGAPTTSRGPARARRSPRVRR